MSIPTRSKIGDQLQMLRKKAGFESANEFAEHIGINPATYTGYEQGKGMFTYERAWVVADALKCSLDDLGGRDWPQRGGLAQDERKLVGDYRDTHDYFKPEISDFAERTAERHPKNEAPGDAGSQIERGA